MDPAQELLEARERIDKTLTEDYTQNLSDPPPSTARPPPHASDDDRSVAPSAGTAAAGKQFESILATPLMQDDAPESTRFATFPERLGGGPKLGDVYTADKIKQVVDVKAKLNGRQVYVHLDIGKELAERPAVHGRSFLDMANDKESVAKGDDEDPNVRIEELRLALAGTSNARARKKLQRELNAVELEMAMQEFPETAMQKQRREANEKISRARAQLYGIEDGDGFDRVRGEDEHHHYDPEGNFDVEHDGYADEGDGRRQATADEFGSDEHREAFSEAISEERNQEELDMQMTHNDQIMYGLTGMSAGCEGYQGKFVFANANGPVGFACSCCGKKTGEVDVKTGEKTGDQLDDSDDPIFGSNGCFNKQRHSTVWRQQQVSDAHRLQQLKVEHAVRTHENPEIRNRYGEGFDLDNPEHERWWLGLDTNNRDIHPHRVTQKMANLLLAGRHAEVYRRTQVCGRPTCRTAQLLEPPERYAFWKASHRRPHHEQATENKGATVSLRRNCMLVRKQHLLHLDESNVKSPLFVKREQDRLGLSEPQARALIAHIVDCSQWMQQREKDYLAWADLFIVHQTAIGWRWRSNQQMKEAMHSAARNYVQVAVLPHILQKPDRFKDRAENEHNWSDDLAKFFGGDYETQPVDCVFALMRMQYQIECGDKRVDGFLEDWKGKSPNALMDEDVTSGVSKVEAGPHPSELNGTRPLARNSAHRCSYIAQRAIFEETPLEDVIALEERGRLALTVPSSGWTDPNLFTPEGLYAAVFTLLGEGGTHKVDLEYARDARIEKRGVNHLQALRAANRGKISRLDALSMMRIMGGRGGGRDRTYGAVTFNSTGGKPVFPASGDINFTNNVSVYKRYLTAFLCLGCPDYADYAANLKRLDAAIHATRKAMGGAAGRGDQPGVERALAKIKSLEHEMAREKATDTITAQERTNSMLQFKPAGNDCCAAVNYNSSGGVSAAKWGHVVRRPEVDGNPPARHESLTLDDRSNGDNAKARAILRAKAMAEQRAAALDAAKRRDTEFAYPLGGGASLHRDGLRKAMGFGGLVPRTTPGGLVDKLATALEGPVVEDPSHVSTLGAPALLGQPKPIPTGDGAFASEEALAFLSTKTQRLAVEAGDAHTRLNKPNQEKLREELATANECLIIKDEAPPRPEQRSAVFGIMHQSRALPDPLARTNLRTRAVAAPPAGGQLGALRELSVESKMADAEPKRRRLETERASMDAFRILQPPSMPLLMEVAASFLQTRRVELRLAPIAALERLQATVKMLTLGDSACVGKIIPAHDRDGAPNAHAGCVSIKKVPAMLRKPGRGLMRYADAPEPVRKAAGILFFEAKKKTSEATVVSVDLFNKWREKPQAAINDINNRMQKRRRALKWLQAKLEKDPIEFSDADREKPIFREMLAWARLRCGKNAEARLHERKVLAEWEARKPTVQFGPRAGQPICGNRDRFSIDALFATCTDEQLGELKAWHTMELEPEMQNNDIRQGDGNAKMASRNKALRTAMANPKNYTKDMLGRVGPVLTPEQIGRKDLNTNAVFPWDTKYRTKRGRMEDEEPAAE
jgi:hypothetical protein